MKIRNQIRPHHSKDLMRAMGIALALEEVLKEEKTVSYRNNATSYRYFAGMGVPTRVENLKGGVDKRFLARHGNKGDEGGSK